MAPTAITSLVMVVFALGLLSMACWAWFGDWEPRAHRPQRGEDRIAAEVADLRRAIEAYEREQRGV